MSTLKLTSAEGDTSPIDGIGIGEKGCSDGRIDIVDGDVVTLDVYTDNTFTTLVASLIAGDNNTMSYFGGLIFTQDALMVKGEYHCRLKRQRNALVKTFNDVITWTIT